MRNPNRPATPNRAADRPRRRTPRAPARARLPLLPFGPGGVHGMAPREGSAPSLRAADAARLFSARRRARVPSPAEDSHSGRVRTLGKRVGGNPSRVQIPHPPPAVAPFLIVIPGVASAALAGGAEHAAHDLAAECRGRSDRDRLDHGSGRPRDLLDRGRLRLRRACGRRAPGRGCRWRRRCGWGAAAPGLRPGRQPRSQPLVRRLAVDRRAVRRRAAARPRRRRPSRPGRTGPSATAARAAGSRPPASARRARTAR